LKETAHGRRFRFVASDRLALESVIHCSRQEEVKARWPKRKLTAFRETARGQGRKLGMSEDQARYCMRMQR